MAKMGAPKKLKRHKTRNRKTTVSTLYGEQQMEKYKEDVDKEAAEAAEKLANRPTKDFSTEELGALMQVPPGGAEQHQIRTRSRQFNRIMNTLPDRLSKPGGIFEEGSTLGTTDTTTSKPVRRPNSRLSTTNYKIDPEE